MLFERFKQAFFLLVKSGAVPGDPSGALTPERLARLAGDFSENLERAGETYYLGFPREATATAAHESLPAAVPCICG